MLSENPSLDEGVIVDPGQPDDGQLATQPTDAQPAAADTNDVTPAANIAGAGGDGGSGGSPMCGGAIWTFNDGGRCNPESPAGDITVSFSTITNNDLGGAPGAPGAGGVTGAGGDQNGAVGNTPGALHNAVAIDADWTSLANVIGSQSPPSGATDCNTPAGGSTFSTNTDDSCGFTGNGDAAGQDFAAFALGPLAANNGPTDNRLPGPASSLLDKVPNASCSGAVTTDDQRFSPRPESAGCEIGAVEVAPPVTIAVTKTASQTTVAPNTQVTFTINVTNTGGGTPIAGDTVSDPNCSPPTLTGGDTDSDNVLDPGETWSISCVATAPAQAGTFTNTVTVTVTDNLGTAISASASATVTVSAAGVAGGEESQLPATGWGIAIATLLGMALIGLGTPFVLHHRNRVVHNWRDSRPI
jgi:hypothetical protein